MYTGGQNVSNIHNSTYPGIDLSTSNEMRETKHCANLLNLWSCHANTVIDYAVAGNQTLHTQSLSRNSYIRSDCRVECSESQSIVRQTC